MTTASERVLIVDDDRNLLDALIRAHRKRYDLRAACGPEEGLAAIEKEGPFAVVVSDYQMPRMNGIAFLSRVRQLAPDTVRIMLTGNADYGAAIEAVNRGQIFRFLTKPCNSEVFAAGLNLALEQHRLVRAERVLLEETLRGSVRVLADVLAMANPTAFGRATRLQTYARQIAERLDLEDEWQLETAALLSQIGCISIPEQVLVRRNRGETLEPQLDAMLRGHAQTARELLAHIPRMEEIAEIVARQSAHYRRDGGATIPLGSRVLRVALDFDALVSRGMERAEAVERMRADADPYDPMILAVVGVLQPPGHGAVVETVAMEHLRTGMILDEDIHSTDSGGLVVARGHEVTTGMLERLRNHARLGAIPAAVRVRILVARSPSVSGVE